MKLMKGNYYSNIAIKLDDRNRKIYSDDNFENKLIKLALFLGYDVIYENLTNADSKVDYEIGQKKVFFHTRKNGKRLKIAKDTPFKNCLVKIKRFLKGISINSIIGKIEDFFFYDEEYEEDLMLEPNGSIYSLPVYEVSESNFVVQLIKSGYTVVANLENLTPEDKELFRKRLRISFIDSPAAYHMLGENILVVASDSVEVINFNDPKEEKCKVIYLDDYRNRKK